MATISANTSEKIFTLTQFYGLNENPDGDTKLRFGEAAILRNFCVTRDGNLKKRPGTKTFLTLADGEKVACLWSGMIDHKEFVLAAAGGKLFKIWDDDADEFVNEVIGEVNTEGSVHIFGFNGYAYIMDGHSYQFYDGHTVQNVVGYRPLVTIVVPPDGGGENLEGVNKLNGLRRSWFSPDGEKATFVLPEEDITSIDWIKYTRNDEPITDYTVDLEAGSVTFTTTPEKGVNTIEIAWSVAVDGADTVRAMRYSELYNGAQDTRVFLYGDGSHKAFYSGIDYDGVPRADYFPDLNEMAVGDENTPLTGLIRHFSTMIAFKSHSTWRVQYGSVNLADGELASAFYVVPVNRTIGNTALGQCQLVLNNPRTLFGRDVYEWRGASFGNITNDERQAKRISDRIFGTLQNFDLSKCYCFDDNYTQEYYICCEDRALVHNYVADAWYEYRGLKITSMLSFRSETYVGTSDGRFLHLDEDYLSDDGEAIDCYWESGSMSFGQDYMRKYSAVLWIGIKPQDSGEVYVTVQTDRKSNYTEKVVATQLSSFRRMDFEDLSFKTNRRPMMEKLKIKAKKFVFYKLIFETNTATTGTTILAADIRVRYTGYAKG